MTAIQTARLNLVALDADAIRCLVGLDRRCAELVLGMTLPAEFPNVDELAGFLPIQLRRMEESPARRDWMARMMAARSTAPAEAVEAVGHCGFHGPPEVIGRAEIGYTVFERFRGQGFAKEAASALVGWAFEQGEREVYATVSPDNEPSLAVVRSVGFTQVGTQEDEVDGLELVFVIRPA